MRTYMENNRSYEEERELRRRAIQRRRREEKRRRRIVIAVSLMVLITSVFGIGTIKAKAASKPLYKYYTMIEVQSGDTLWDLAEEYTDGTGVAVRDYVREIEELNHIPHGQLKAGDMLTVVYYSNERN